MKSAVIAARDNEPGDMRLKPSGFNGDQMTSNPEYEAPLVKELELVLVVFDILYMGAQVGSTIAILPIATCLLILASLRSEPSGADPLPARTADAPRRARLFASA